MYRKYFKRVLDLVISLIAFTLLLPLLLIITFLLFISNKGKPFFFQQRPGKNDRLFWLIKFKTMNDKRGADGQLLPDEKRITNVGKFVRKTSLDEIPQLLNVICGSMSIVGPRPLLIEYLGLYNEYQKRRHEIRPGITGWAQVNGRNAISWKQKFDYDIWYVDHVSLKADLKIFWLTIIKVFKSEGINAGGSVAMEKFKGNLKESQTFSQN